MRRTDLPVRLARLARQPATIAAALWSAVIVAIGLTGQRFDGGYLTYGWQLVPVEILRADPFGSVWNLHIQPPLWNLTVGVVMRWSPLPDLISLQIVQVGFGIVLVACLAAAASRFVPRWAAVAAALIAGLHPDTVANAFTPTYELATAALLAAVVWVVVCCRQCRRWPLAAAALATVVGLVRSLYHPVAIVAGLVVLGLIAIERSQRRRAATVLLVPVMLFGGWMLKNEVMFGRATMSSWFGMNLQRAVIPPLPKADLDQLRANGKISEIAEIGPFGNYALYAPVMPPCQPEHDHPALTTSARINAVVVPNFNYECFLPVFDQAGTDAMTVIRAYPWNFVRGRLWSARTWFVTSGFAESSPSPLLRADSWIYGVLGAEYTGAISTAGWGTPIYASLEAAADFSVTIIIATGAVLLGGLAVVAAHLRRRSRAWSDAHLALLAVAAIAAYTFAAGTTFELGEQARFRTMTDPVVLTTAIVAVIAAVRSLRGRRQAGLDLLDTAGPANQVERGGGSEVDPVGA